AYLIRYEYDMKALRLRYLKDPVEHAGDRCGRGAGEWIIVYPPAARDTASRRAETNASTATGPRAVRRGLGRRRQRPVLRAPRARLAQGAWLRPSLVSRRRPRPCPPLTPAHELATMAQHVRYADGGRNQRAVIKFVREDLLWRGRV